jgi:hypothetical protein
MSDNSDAFSKVAGTGSHGNQWECGDIVENFDWKHILKAC